MLFRSLRWAAYSCRIRRAAIEAAYGLVSSYLSNYSNWLDDAARERGSRPPRLGFSNVFPPLYGGNMIKLGADWRSAEIKLLKADGQWAFSPALRVKGRLKRLATHATLCPSLILRGSKASLSCPVEVRPVPVQGHHRVCAVDVGINTAATAAIIAGSEAAQRGIRGCPQGKPWAYRQKFRASDENTVGARGYLGACPDVRRAFCDRDWGVIGCPDYSA